MDQLRRQLLKFMGGKNYRPMDKSELARKMGVQSGERRAFRILLSKLEKEGKIVIGAKSRYKIRERAQTVLVGVLRFQQNGNGWFFPHLADEGNVETGFDIKKYDRIFVDCRDMGVALDGDIVSLKVTRVGVPKWKKYAEKGRRKRFDRKGKEVEQKPEREHKDEAAGKVLKVLERKNPTVIGFYREEGQFCYVEPEEQALPPGIDLLEAGGAKPGQIVAVEITQWTHRQAAPVGKVVKVIGYPSAPGVDIISVIHKHRLRVEFEPEVQKEAEAVSEQIDDQEIARREDWRGAMVLTVDPGDAKDHDDAVLVEETGDGWKLAVHIADVSHYVRPHTALDKEAELRGNSTYLVDRVLPMLPEKLSNNVCSLRPHVDRLTKCAVMEFDRTGARTSAYFCDAVINSKAKLAYEEAQVFIKEGGGGEVGDAIRRAWGLADVLRKRRFDMGALDLDFPEVKVVLDEQSKKPIEVQKLVYDESHQMIEEFMLAANEAVAVELKMKRRNAMHRIHEDPDADRLNEFAEIARIHGFQVGDLTNKKHIQELLRQAKGQAVEQSIKLGLLKSLKRAAYSIEGLGHYGLAKMDYCHFTSPIRRYADLVVHRALQHVLVNPPEKPDRLPKSAKLEEIAQHISDTERNSAEAENATKRMKMMEYLYDLSQSDKEVSFEALITDVRRMGLFVEITDMSVKGLVKRESLPRGNWDFEQNIMAYRNYKAKKELRLGQKVRVRIQRVDVEKQLVDFVLIEQG
ncbi:ribonuclease R [Rubritalea tangerina]|uniref:Ribonuclease R n=1 Tax=Rubritalea tangerina TaxID=430798 RepID=A0ABW4ZA88_9BACT